MGEYFMRDGAPLDDKGWAKVDGMVMDVMKKNLVARRFVEFVGPLGWGVEVVPSFGFEMEGQADVVTETAQYIPLAELSQEFLIRAKQLAMSDQTPFGLDLGAVATAASKLAKSEDNMILGGLMEVAQIQSPLGDWDTMGGPFRSIVQATAALRQNGCDGSYSVIMSPGMYARMASLMQHGRREMDMVERLAGKVLQSVVMPEEAVLVVSSQAWNFDMVVGQDVVTAYLGNEGLDHRFRLFETLVLRVKRPEAVCVVK